MSHPEFSYGGLGIPKEKPTSRRAEKVMINVVRNLTAEPNRFIVPRRDGSLTSVSADRYLGSNPHVFAVTDVGGDAGVPAATVFKPYKDIMYYEARNDESKHATRLIGGVIFHESPGVNDLALSITEATKAKRTKDQILWWLPEYPIGDFSDPADQELLKSLIVQKTHHWMHPPGARPEIPGSVLFDDKGQHIVDRITALLTPEQAAIAFPA